MSPVSHTPGPCPQRLAMLAATLLATLLAGCGGGGGGGDAAVEPPAGNTGVPATATASFVVSQASANALVLDVTQRTRDLRLANGLTSGIKTGAAAPGAGMQATPDAGTQALALVLAENPQKHALADGDLRDYSSTLCSSGSASLDIPQALLDRFIANSQATLQAGDRIGLVASRCVVKAPVELGAVALGDFGTGATVDGRFDLTLVQRSGNDVQWRLVYSQFSYAPAGAAAFAPLDATLVFGTVGGQSVYTLDIPQLRFLAAPVVGQVGDSVTIAGGKLRGPLASASGTGYADYQFKGWVFDINSLRANAGSVTADGAGGAQALVTATASGYTVRFTTAAGSTSFNVAR